MLRTAGLVAILSALTAASFAQPAPPPLSQNPPPGANPETGARPGNEIGTGSSLPFSDKASNITPETTTSAIAPNLPAPSIGDDATITAYLEAARTALVLDRTGEAQQALEMAETRALDRSVPLFQTNVPSKNALVEKIGGALNALGSGDRGAAVTNIEAALKLTNHSGTD